MARRPERTRAPFLEAWAPNPTRTLSPHSAPTVEIARTAIGSLGPDALDAFDRVWAHAQTEDILLGLTFSNIDASAEALAAAILGFTHLVQLEEEVRQVRLRGELDTSAPSIASPYLLNARANFLFLISNLINAHRVLHGLSPSATRAVDADGTLKKAKRPD